MPIRASGTSQATVIVTRPQADAGPWLERLQQEGWPVEALPLIDIVAVDDAAPAYAAWRNLYRYAALMFVSSNAVRYFFASKPLVGIEKHLQDAAKEVANWPVDLRFMAPGPGTAAALLAAGVPPAQMDAPALDAPQFDSQALWAALAPRSWQDQRVLLVRGATISEGSVGSASTPEPGSAQGTSRDWLVQQWRSAGAQVDVLTVYQRRAPSFTEAQLQRIRMASCDGSVWLLSSAQALAYLPVLPELDWSQARAVATHPRIVQAARLAGWGQVLASRASLADVVVSIKSLHGPIKSA